MKERGARILKKSTVQRRKEGEGQRLCNPWRLIRKVRQSYLRVLFSLHCLLIPALAFIPTANKNENAAFWHILKDFPTDLVAQEWVETYNSKNAPEFHRQIFNFLVWSCGGVKNYFDKKRDLADLTEGEWEVRACSSRGLACVYCDLKNLRKG